MCVKQQTGPNTLPAAAHLQLRLQRLVHFIHFVDVSQLPVGREELGTGAIKDKSHDQTHRRDLNLLFTEAGSYLCFFMVWL